MVTSPSGRSDEEKLRGPEAPAASDHAQLFALASSDHAELFALSTSRTYRWSHPRGRRRTNGPQLRGRQADEAARRYLDNALCDGCWHELEGLSILAWAQGIPRRAFEDALSALALETARRGFLEQQFVRLAREPCEWLERECDELVAAGEAEWVPAPRGSDG